MSTKEIICTSSKPIVFSNIQNQSKLSSEEFKVPEIDASWRMEVSPGNGCASFNQTNLSPKVKITIKIKDQPLVDSKLLSVTINMNEVSSEKSNNMFFANYAQAISSPQTVIDTTSVEYQSSATSQQQENVYHQDLYGSSYYSIQWQWMQSLSFSCSISFNYYGKYSKISHTIERLIASEQVFNVETFTLLFADDTFKDFTFVVRGKEFKVHKCLLSIASDVFLKMFTCGLDETKDNTATLDYAPEVFGIFIKFIYTNACPVEKMPPICMELYELAHLYEIKLLVKICHAFIMDKEIDSSNALELYEFASTYKIEKLLETTWAFVKTDMLDIPERCEPKTLDQIKDMLEKKRKYEADRLKFISQDATSVAASAGKTKNSARLTDKLSSIIDKIIQDLEDSSDNE